ncbi:DUF418 domain-containing protein [Marinobacterium arenosum]|uniref:DUF418 domain-containing protein n=1 Tax=Marinobacterium arenosum TaxID=2862496 RepID=UPI001C94E2BD|nr:DUF418 domain-containing protein [Marinobacterium arenosum]MBY4676246.1 DUF418 domain-containing protein [Marinobacterium arenosum]
MAAVGKSVSERLDGLDLARLFAFVGMVIVNFNIVMAGDAPGGGFFGGLIAALEGKAAATFVVLAGVGLGLETARALDRRKYLELLARALFLLLLGMLNALIFQADILHYYAFYFLFGMLVLRLAARWLLVAMLGCNLVFVLMILLLDYDSGWNWGDYSYVDFWSPGGFLRNLLFNGWHPLFPWLSFLIFGLLLGRLRLGERRCQSVLLLLGGLGLLLVEALSARLTGLLAGTELAVLVTTKPVPPMPLYMLSGFCSATLLIAGCLLVASRPGSGRWLQLLLPAGRQTLTLYIAHILIGVESLEAMGLIGARSSLEALLAAALFCSLAVGYAYLWSCRFGRGPIETAMRGFSQWQRRRWAAALGGSIH